MGNCSDSSTNKSANDLLHYIDEVDSTNEELKRRLAERMLPHGYGLMARAQTSGKGRCGRTWSSFNDDLAASFLLRLPMKLALPLPLVAGLAVTDMLMESGLSLCGLKWPNDILVPEPGNKNWQNAGRAKAGESEPILPLTHKICGILCENAGTYGDECLIIAGIGINLNSEPNLSVADRPAASFWQLTGLRLEPDKAFEALAHCLDCRVKELMAYGFAPHDMQDSLKNVWYSRCVYKEGYIEATAPYGVICGKVCGLGDEGQLIVSTDAGIKEIWAGDVEKTRQSVQA